MDRFNPIPVKINSDGDFAKFLEDNKDKIRKDVKVERVVSGLNGSLLQNNCDQGMVIHAFTLSLGLYLPFDPLISEILGRLHRTPIQLAPNCWRVMFGILALNRYFCKINLGWKEFCYCYIAKRNPAGFYYFSPRQKNYALVTDLPNSEKGWKDVLIYLKGNWGGAATGNTSTPFPITENTSGEPPGSCSCYTGSKPDDSEVNMKDLNKAWSFGNKNWRYLLDPANWGTCHREQVTEINYNNNNGAASVLLTKAREEVMFQGVNLENIDKEVVERPGQPGVEAVVDEMTKNVSLSFQPPSKKQKTIHDLVSGAVAVAHDDHIMNLESTPATGACGGDGQEATGSDFSQLQHSITPKAGIELFQKTMNTLRSSLFSAECKSYGKFDHFENAIQLLGEKPVGEAVLVIAQLLVMVGLRVTSFAESQDHKDKTIKELEATIERLEKDLTASKLAATWKNPNIGTGMEHLTSSMEASFENLKKAIFERMDERTQKTEMRPHGQINEPASNSQLQSQEKRLRLSPNLVAKIKSWRDRVYQKTKKKMLQGQNKSSNVFPTVNLLKNLDQHSENLNEGRPWKGTQPQGQGQELSMPGKKLGADQHSENHNEGQDWNGTHNLSHNISLLGLLLRYPPGKKLGADQHSENHNEGQDWNGTHTQGEGPELCLLGEESGAAQHSENGNEGRAWNGTQPQGQGSEYSPSWEEEEEELGQYQHGENHNEGLAWNATQPQGQDSELSPSGIQPIIYGGSSVCRNEGPAWNGT